VADHDSEPGAPRDLAIELNRLIVAAERRSSQSRGSVKRTTLARRIGVSASSLYAYLDGTTLPTTVTLDRLLHAATQLAALCVGLPLAIRVAAEHAATRTEPLADLVAELRSHRLDGLRTDGDERTAVRTVFSWSYHRLPPDTARTFRTIGQFPGRDFTIRAIAAATGTPHLADDLVDAHLLERHGDRFRLHDLLRDYAAELAATPPTRPRPSRSTRGGHRYDERAGALAQLVELRTFNHLVRFSWGTRLFV